MTHRFFGLILLTAVGAVGVYTGVVSGQDAQRATTAASAATPRISDGHPDLNGYWYRRRAPTPPARRVGA